jgi:hypothetical protein
MVETIAKKEGSKDAIQPNIWKHIEMLLETQGSYAAVSELERITGESDKLFLTNEIFIHCL